MSVSFQQFIVFGIKLPYNFFEKNGSLTSDEAYEMLEPYINNANENKPDSIGCIYDGMNGEYIILGQVIMKSDKNQPLDMYCYGNMLNSRRELMRERVKSSLQKEFDINWGGCMSSRPNTGHALQIIKKALLSQGVLFFIAYSMA